MVGHLGTAPSISWSQARRVNLSHSCPIKLADGGGHSPQTFAGSLCFQDRFGAVVRFTIQLKWLSRRESHSRPLPSQGSALVLLSYGIIENGGGCGYRPRSLNLARIGRPYDYNPQIAAGRSCTRIFDVRSVALLILLSYGSVKVDSCVGLAPTNDRVATGRFDFFSLQEESAVSR